MKKFVPKCHTFVEMYKYFKNILQNCISLLVPLSSLEAMCRGVKPSMLTIAVSDGMLY